MGAKKLVVHKIMNRRTSYIVIALSLFFLLLLYPGVLNINLAQGQTMQQEDNVAVDQSADNLDLIGKIIIGLCIIVLGMFLSYKLMINSCDENYGEPTNGIFGDARDVGPVTGDGCGFSGFGKEDDNKVSNLKKSQKNSKKNYGS